MQTSSSEPQREKPKPASQAAIARSLKLAVANLRDAQQNGWWSYVDDKGPSTEATSWCALALYAALSDGFDSSFTTEYLLNNQAMDGGWSTAPNCNISDWSTAPALLALRLLNEKKNENTRAVERAVIRGANFLFDLRTDPFKSVGRFFKFLAEGERGLNYERGWPWTKECSYWVEPTVYSLLALKLPVVPDRQIIREAIRHASQYLHSHRCHSGGWNHGAFFVLHVYAPPYTLTTAEALVALQDEPLSREPGTVIDTALKFITQDNLDANSTLPLAWTILALHAYGRDLTNKTAQLLSHQKLDGGFGTSNLATALAILALVAASKDMNLLKMNVARES